MTLAQKSEKLRASLAEAGTLLVAYSGGTDSAFVAYVAHQTLGDRMLAVIADSPSLPRAELHSALLFTAEHRIPTRVLQTSELENAEYQRNDAQRCFHCKSELFNRMEQARQELGYASIAYGMNVDDRGEFRPGQRAAAEHGVLAPLVDAGLTKTEIRTLAAQMGLSVAEKPASACLSSRIEYGRPVTIENLSQVEQAEHLLHELGFAQVRVRHHGELARIEVAQQDLHRFASLPLFQQITSSLHELGFKYVTLDLDGYRSGSMNAVLPVSVLTNHR